MVDDLCFRSQRDRKVSLKSALNSFSARTLGKPNVHNVHTDVTFRRGKFRPRERAIANDSWRELSHKEDAVGQVIRERRLLVVSGRHNFRMEQEVYRSSTPVEHRRLCPKLLLCPNRAARGLAVRRRACTAATTGCRHGLVRCSRPSRTVSARMLSGERGWSCRLKQLTPPRVRMTEILRLSDDVERPAT